MLNILDKAFYLLAAKNFIFMSFFRGVLLFLERHLNANNDISHKSLKITGIYDSAAVFFCLEGDETTIN